GLRFAPGTTAPMLGGLAGPGGVALQTTVGAVEPVTLSLTTGAADPYAGSLTGPGALVVVGGNHSFTGANAHTGGTTVLDGTLSVSSDSALGAGPVAVAALGTLNFSASTTTARSLAVGGGTLAVASGAALTLNGAVLSGGYLAGPGTFATAAAGGTR